MILPAILLIQLIQEITAIDLDDHALADLSNQFGIMGLILLGGIVGPLIEEIIFRLPLNYKRNYLFKLVGVVVGKESVKRFWFKNYSLFFYLFIIAFALVHITNYKNESLSILLLSPILVLPQIIGGTVLAYLRMKIGFFWGFLHHAIFNSILMILALFINLEEKVMIDNEHYRLKIEVAENRFGNQKVVDINRDFDFISEIEIEYAQFNQIAKQMDWDTVSQKQNRKFFNIEFNIKNLQINSDSVLKYHLKEIIEDQ
ncbi:CAAX protease self-immunity [Marivirga sericea]|uniref:CAAX protease self-immunity n=1 Tax=Marivirga sericea TaxID=1028 RepID=A0A1X7JZA9_9BACT|nr:CPBP family intramembrane glutamic endopeptidase [Marivirga sericea]SMG33676.1 CAAX protease self-immunity [Marivirga sericea]